MGKVTKVASIALIAFSLMAASSHGQIQQQNAADSSQTKQFSHLGQDSADLSRIGNASLLHSFFEKLLRLENTKDGKVNIVHIGDSHVQSNFLSNAIRRPLQEQFGNGGRGFLFPYSMRRRNPDVPFSFVSDVAWQICRNNQPSRCEPGTEFGLGGYGLSTDAERFVVALEVNAERYKFNTIKIVSAADQPVFRLAMADGYPIAVQRTETSAELHTIKRGETLGAIARRYNVTVAAIKQENNLRSDNIRAGAKLRIPRKTIEEASVVDTSMFRSLEYQRQERFISSYHQEEPVSAIYLLPARQQARYNLNGMIIENDSSGVLFHNIGTPSSQMSHFNATPLFFEQLPVLSPDLVIVSFGTNESFGRISLERFIAQMERLLQNIWRTNPDVPILVTTPHTSLFRGGALNTFVFEYAKHLVQRNDVALWDLYAFTGGLEGAKERPAEIQIRADMVHYTSQGYINQGTALANAILNEYKYYKQNLETETLNWFGD